MFQLFASIHHLLQISGRKHRSSPTLSLVTTGRRTRKRSQELTEALGQLGQRDWVNSGRSCHWFNSDLVVIYMKVS